MDSGEHSKRRTRIPPAVSVFVCLVLTAAIARQAMADESADAESLKPLWEFGLFTAFARLPHYRGSDEYHDYVLPLPYFIYRGEVIKADREGLRGIFYKGERFETDISFFGNPPVDEDNEARENMPELDPIIEIGPALKIHVIPKTNVRVLFLTTALRAVISANKDNMADMAHEGLRGGVRLVYRNQAPFGYEAWGVGLTAGPDFADRRFNGYFYDVDELYVETGREFFESDGGYAGMTASASVARKLTRWLTVAGFARWENVEGAAFEDSPLVRQKNSMVAGCALIWKIAKSKRLVDVSEADETL